MGRNNENPRSIYCRPELDTNVDPSSTLQLVRALNEADKDYELLFVPGGGHGAGRSPYGLCRQSSFFRLHLNTNT